MREQQSFQPEQYRTGPTAPPKNHRGMIAILLMAVIFLSGVVSIMGVMNIHLFHLLQNQQDTVSLQVQSNIASPMPRTAASYHNHQARLGITCHEITPFYQEYYQIPQGIYISYVEPDSDCFAKGLRDGDILLHFNRTQVTDFDTLLPLINNCRPGDTAQLRFYRNGAEHTITVTLSQQTGE